MLAIDRKDLGFFPSETEKFEGFESRDLTHVLPGSLGTT